MKELYKLEVVEGGGGGGDGAGGGGVHKPLTKQERMYLGQHIQVINKMKK